MSEEINQENPIPIKEKKSFFKTTKSKVVIAITVICFVFLTVSGIALARHFGKFGDGPHGFIIDRIVENLDLTASQKEQVEKIKAEIKQQHESKKQNRENLFEEFANEFKKDNLDKNTLRDLNSKREQGKKESEEYIMDKIIEVHNMLTPEQRNKAIDLLKEMKSKFHDGKKNRGDIREKD